MIAQVDTVISRISVDGISSGELISIVAMVVSGVTAVIGAFVVAYAKKRAEDFATKADFENALVQLRRKTEVAEAEKARAALASAIDNELRAAIYKVTVALASILHSMCWITWDATERKKLNSGLVQNYDAEVHRLSPELTAQLAIIASLDKSLHDQLEPLVFRAFALDVLISKAIVACEHDHPDGLQGLEACHKRALGFERRVRRETAEIVARRFRSNLAEQ